MIHIIKKVLKDYYNTDFSLGHSIDVDYHMDFHFHDVFEIYYNLSGGEYYFIRDEIYDIQPGDLFIMNNFDIHKPTTKVGVPYERYVLVFKPEFVLPFCTEKTNLLECFIKRPSNFSNKIHLSKEADTTIKVMFSKLENIKGYGSDVLEKAYLLEILVFINELFKGNTYSNTLEDSQYNDKIKPILYYINENLSGDLSLDLISDKLHISKYYLCELFKKYTGTTINKYIIARRITEAKKLLGKDIPLNDVIAQTGFNDYCHFIRTFKSLLGVSPKQYSRNLRGEANFND